MMWLQWLIHKLIFIIHDDVVKWKYFPRYWPFVRGIHRSPVNSPHKGQWRGALMFTLICTRINGWVNNGEAGDLRRYRAHYDVIVMRWQGCHWDEYLNTFITKMCIISTWWRHDMNTFPHYCAPVGGTFASIDVSFFSLTMTCGISDNIHFSETGNYGVVSTQWESLLASSGVYLLFQLFSSRFSLSSVRVIASSSVGSSINAICVRSTKIHGLKKIRVNFSTGSNEGPVTSKVISCDDIILVDVIFHQRLAWFVVKMKPGIFPWTAYSHNLITSDIWLYLSSH